MKKEDVLKIKKCVEILNTLTQYWENDTVIIPHEMDMKECGCIFVQSQESLIGIS